MDHLNVFRGPNSVADYFDPDNNPLLPLVEIPDSLNPFRHDGVRIYAKLLTALPAHNVKSLPGTSSSFIIAFEYQIHAFTVICS